MALEQLLRKLVNVRKVGGGKFVACCPAHEDRTASLGIRVERDDRVLVHCFGGCQTAEVLASLDLNWDVLFADTLHDQHAKKVIRTPFNAYDALAALHLSCLEANMYCKKMAAGARLTPVEANRLQLIASRLSVAHTYVERQFY
jgi:hypothetical protein